MTTSTLGALPDTSDEVFVALDNLADSVTGLTDLGYKHARTKEAGAALALRAGELIAGFPENVSDEDKNRVCEGYRLRKDELDGTVYYRLEGKDTYHLSTKEAYLKDQSNHMALNVAYAFSYTQQQFGALKKEQPNKHALIGAVRTAVNKYCSNTWNSLVSTYKALTRGPRERSTNLSFYDWLGEQFDAIEKRAKVARTREGGDVPSEAQLKKAVAAFKRALD
jgi:hypothetical protein